VLDSIAIEHKTTPRMVGLSGTNKGSTALPLPFVPHFQGTIGEMGKVRRLTVGLLSRLPALLGNQLTTGVCQHRAGDIAVDRLADELRVPGDEREVACARMPDQ
jgi:hypothetical protein